MRTQRAAVWHARPAPKDTQKFQAKADNDAIAAIPPVTAGLRKLAPTEVELDIEVSQADFAHAQDRAFRKLVAHYKVPGFRAGHVPRKIFEQHVGKDSIESRALEDLVPEVYAQAVKEHQLEPVDRPRIDLDRTGAAQGVRIKATVAVRPEINLGQYRGIPVKRTVVAVTDEEVEHSIEALRKRAASLEPVEDRGVQDGDTITIDYLGLVNGEAFEGSSASHHTVEVSPDRFIPGFTEQLHGARAGDHRQVKVTFPSDHRNSELAGKEATFDVTVHEIKRAVLPELGDDFARQISEHETVAALRADVRRRLEAVAQARSNEDVERQVLDAIAVSHDIPLPDVLVEREIDSLIADAKSYMRRIGRPWEEYLAAKKADEAGLRTEYREEAVRRVKTALLLEEIAKREQIKVATEEIDREVEVMAQSYGQPKEAVVEFLRKTDGFGPIIDTVSRRKTLDLLVDQAHATEVAAAVTQHGT